ncbi:MAG: nicotinamide-nucleotide amidohydrolase family protein, partial [Gemmatimonadetes bacterium]|nr:nicotinamide-nucleotide amidohydrolase family protein [Gemmatimonadota bacterium]
SCTGGMLGARLTAIAGASRSFVGGVMAYADAVKRRLLEVPQSLLDSDGAVSESVARAMASGVAAALGADCGVGITGVAGPGGGSDEKPVGTVWIGWRVPGPGGEERVEARRYRFTGDREAVRIRATQAALHGLVARLPDEASG